ncbi:unnamed protein product [Ambrosiozyma monospora]|uniref:Unnamed protein product n=1 Tax=Ambrosiozyma monospora TaxID=43982 RepID=A0ACB5TCW6_AMBMO|nr:unnamed protein product [Ambrosiozyma monospora]
MKAGFNELIKDSIGEAGLVERVFMTNIVKENETLMKEEWNCSLLLWNNRVHWKSSTAEEPVDYIFEPHSCSISWFKERIDKCVDVATKRIHFEKALLEVTTVDRCNTIETDWSLEWSIISLQTSMFCRTLFDRVSHFIEINSIMPENRSVEAV